jgi:hypothetical protein
MAEWHTVESARDEWPDAPYDEDGGDTLLTSLLAAAQLAVVAYAPVQADMVTIDPDGYIVSEEYVVPDGYRIAQLMQARNIWNSGKASPSGDFDGAGYGLSTFPLDWQVRQLIRPKRGRPVIA